MPARLALSGPHTTTLVGLAKQNRSELGLNSSCKQIDQPTLQPGHPLCQRNEPPSSDQGSSLQQVVQRSGIKLQQRAILDRASVERLGLTQEHRNVAEHITGSQNLQGHPAALDRPRQFNRTSADNVHHRSGLALSKHERSAGVGLLAHLLGEHLDVALAQRGSRTAAQATRKPRAVPLHPCSHRDEPMPRWTWRRRHR